MVPPPDFEVNISIVDYLGVCIGRVELTNRTMHDISSFIAAVVSTRHHHHLFLGRRVLDQNDMSACGIYVWIVDATER